MAVFGAGPVGLMAAYSAILRGSPKVYVVDRVPERLAKAKEIGAIPIDFSKSDAVEQIEKLNGGLVDRAVDAVGYQAVGMSGDKEEPNIVLSNLIRVTRPTGGLGIPGLYVPSDPGAPDKNYAEGIISLVSKAARSIESTLGVLTETAFHPGCSPSASCSRRVLLSALASATSRL